MSQEHNNYKEAWSVGQSGWSSYLDEAEKDTRAFCGDQWDPLMRQYLKSQSRSEAVYNKIKRVVNFVSGYERRNRLGLSAKPRGMSDGSLANQQSALLLNTMSNYGGYNICSDAFKFGTCVSGLNLVEVYIDPEGNIAFNRDAYNQILLDPLFTKPDLSDCAWILKERAITREQAKLFFPGREREIDLLGRGTTSNLFSRATHNSRIVTKDSIVYGEYHRQTQRNAIMLMDLQTGLETEFEGDQNELNFVATQLRDKFSLRNKPVKSMRLQVFLQDELFYDGPDPYGMDEYRFTPIMGDYVPELVEDKYKLQGIVRAIRDPQVEFNKRMSQEVDLVESQIAGGWIAEEGQVVDPKALYQTGQGKVVFVKSRDDGNLAGTAAISRIPAPTISAGMDQLSNKQASLIDTMAGTNEELFGSDSKDIPGVLSRMRTGAALTILHPYFDGYRLAKRRIGKLVIKMAQKNYVPAKIEQITEEAIHPQFFDNNILDNDITVQEGIHTDSQREAAYMEFKELRAAGFESVTEELLIEVMPIQMENKLKDHIRRASEAQAQQAQKQTELEMQQLQVNTELIQSETAKNMANVEKMKSEAVENIAEAGLDRAKTVNEMIDAEDKSKAQREPRKPRHKKAKAQ